ncbi:MAG: hypothetical protein II562_00660 [Prevotella sp.]|nr:hypothetical protein [Prevotella sp.]
MMRKHIIFTLALALTTLSGYAQQRSAKRGMCWDEKTQALTNTTVAKMAPGVSWLYNWGVAPTGSASNLGAGESMDFAPMCWNSAYNESKLRSWLNAHPGAKYLLAFNEPNFSSQANMTPQAAANAWSKVEQIAADYGLEIVAPALNFTAENVGGRKWSPMEWYDEFFRLVPNAKVDYLAMHCYMNWAENVDWICSRYFYTDAGENDLYREENKAKYPNLVAFLDNYKNEHGHFPKMMLTEFCSWEENVYPYRSGMTRDFQITQMTQKLQYMEKSDLVAGYAWFMANPGGGENEFPYESIFKSNNSQSELSELGLVYTYMSSFDTEKYYGVDEKISAKDYIDASLNDQAVLVRRNSDSGNDEILQVGYPTGGYTMYQIDVPWDGEYQLTLHMKSTAQNKVYVCLDRINNYAAREQIASTGGVWTDCSIPITLTAGKHLLYVYNSSTQTMYINRLKLTTTTGIQTVEQSRGCVVSTRYYTPAGAEVQQPTEGLYIMQQVMDDGSTRCSKQYIH